MAEQWIASRTLTDTDEKSVLEVRIGLPRPADSIDWECPFSRGDVRHIVPTHLDLDHAGVLPDFPAATVHIFADEHYAAMRRATRLERERYKPAHFAHAPRWQRHELAGDTWLGLQRVRCIADDVVLVPIVGHTRGHCAVAVRRDGSPASGRLSVICRRC